MLEAHQKGIHDSLTGMEGEAERLYREERPLADDEAVERDVLYERAEKVTAVLTRLGEQLGEAISDTNEVTAANLGDGSAPLGKLVRVLNNQLNALMQLEAQTEEMSEKLASLQVTGHSNGV
jgi:nuclear pore complex protein Nup62